MILFVCSGNTCRSPLAEVIAKKIFSKDKKFQSTIISAGTSARDGLPASPLAIEVAGAKSLDLSNHKAKLLSRTLAKDADVIVALGANHRDTVGIIEPAALEYTFMMTDFCEDEDGDVLDPIGMGLEAYEATYALLEKCIERMKKKLTRQQEG